MTVAVSQRWTNAVQEALSSRYEFQAPLGRGGFATVWRVINRQLGRTEALKVLADVHGEDQEFVGRFTREAQIAASLDHPNIVDVYEFGVTEGIFWYSMQLVEGRSLLEEIDAGRQFTADETVAILGQVLSALATIHQRGVLHRDIKPANIILDVGGTPHLLDFGIAKAEGPSGATRTGTVVGTPAFMAPEALLGRPVDNRADLFAVGVTAYQMLSGRLPYQSTESTQLLLERVTQPPLPLMAALPEGNRALAAVVMRALAADPADRFRGAAEMVAALHESLLAPAQAGPSSPSSVPAPPSLQPITLRQNAPTTPLRPRRRIGIALGLATLLAAFALGLGWLARSPSPDGMAAPAPGVDRVGGPRPAAEPTTAAPAVPVPAPPTDDRPAMTSASRAPARPPAAAPGPAAPVRPALRQVVTPPQLLDDPRPVVPPELATDCGGRDIPFKLEIDEAGRVRTARALGAHRATCRALAEAAVRGFTFRPGLDAAGAPVAAPLALSVHLPP